MKEANSPILEKAGRRSGMTVPEGFFEQFALQMEQQLPARNLQIERPRTAWQHVRPYLYLAAMFAGVWCMLKMFTLWSTQPEPMTFENTPELVQAVNDRDYVINELIIPYDDYDAIQIKEGDTDFIDRLASSTLQDTSAINAVHRTH